MTKLDDIVLDVTVVGLQFRWTKDGRNTLARNVPIPVHLEREPDNDYDENAVKVIIAAPYELTELHDRQLGFIRAKTVRHLAPRFDRDEIEVIESTVTEVRVEKDEADLHLVLRKKKPAKRKSVTKT